MWRVREIAVRDAPERQVGFDDEKEARGVEPAVVWAGWLSKDCERQSICTRGVVAHGREEALEDVVSGPLALPIFERTFQN